MGNLLFAAAPRLALLRYKTVSASGNRVTSVTLKAVPARFEPHGSLPGLARQSIIFAKILAKIGI
jgi:hypothetical protein